MAFRGFAFLIAAVIGCDAAPSTPSTPLDELRAKSWSQYEAVRPGSTFRFEVFFDDHDGIVVLSGSVIYRLDLDTRVWSNVGTGPGPWYGGMFTDLTGSTFYGRGESETGGGSWIRSVATDPFAWEEDERLGSAREVFFGRTIYKLFEVPGVVGKRLVRLDGDQFTTLRTDIEGTLAIDYQGDPMLVDTYADGATRGVFGLDDTGQQTRTLFACTRESTPLCRNALDGLFTHADQSITWATLDASEGSFMNRSLPDSAEPTRFANFPTAHEGITYTNTTSLAVDELGNMYTTRNSRGSRSLFVLYAGTEAWEYVNDIPGPADVVRVRRDGTLFAFNSVTGDLFYVLE